MAEDEHSEAPPCVQKMVASGVESGARNLATFQFGVYAKKAFPSTWKAKLEDFAVKVCSPSMGKGDINKTQRSIAGRDYKYKCSDEPCKSLCDSKKCIDCLLYTSPSPRDGLLSRMPSSA